jgi:heterodisulfide reductase subunit C
LKEKNKDLNRGTPAPDLKTEVEKLLHDNKLHLCFECGKCSAVCPMLDFYGEYNYDRSPRGVVERLSFAPEKIDDESLWYCLTCQACTFFCPSGIDFQSFMTDLRELLLKKGLKKHAFFCSVCGRYFMPKKELEAIKKILDGKKSCEYMYVCPECRKKDYAEVLHRMAHWPKQSMKKG